jgi:hypothetical protein
MAGYAVARRVQGGGVHARPAARPPIVLPLPSPVPAAVVEEREGGNRGARIRLRDRWTDFCEQFGQLTWYLVNPDGWR